MTDTNPDQIVTTIDFDGGDQLTVTSEDPELPYETSTPPAIEIHLELAVAANDDHVSIQLLRDLDEAGTEALIAALTQALAVSRRRATERGYYRTTQAQEDR